MRKEKSTLYSFFFLLAIFILFFQFSHTAFAAKYYQIKMADISATLHDDGSLEVIESRTYKFVGSYRYAYRTMPTDGPVRFDDFYVSENGVRYKLSDSEEPGSYKIIPGAGKVEIRWFFRASHETRTFDFHYRAENAVQRYEDAAVLYFKFISEEWGKRHENVLLKIVPPQKIAPDQLNEWLHGPLWAESRIMPDGTITAWCTNLPPRRYLEIRALYPPEIFPNAPLQMGRVREQIMQQEALWAEQANRQREEMIQKELAKQKRRATGKWLVPLFSLVVLAFGIRLFMRYGKKPQIPGQPKISSEVPENTPPALVSYLLYNRQIGGSALVATLFDLARRGFLSLREEPKERKGFFGFLKPKADYFWILHRDHYRQHSRELAPFEDDLLRFIFEDLAEGADEINLKTITRKRTRVIKFFRKWKKEIAKLGRERNWFDPKSQKGLYLVLALDALIVLVTVAFVFLFGLWAIVLAVISPIVLVLAFLMPHRTREGETMARKWLALKEYLKKYHYRAADRSSLLANINDYFVYGIVLGLNKKIFQELAAFIPADNYNHFIPWYVYHGRGSFSPEAFSSSFSSMLATTTSAMSSSTGSGGGASGGGGGGASSGGGGAG